MCENLEKENCGICLSELGEGYECELLCSHNYHMDCIFAWFDKDKSCPLCRSQVSDETIEFLCDNSDGQYSYDDVEQEVEEREIFTEEDIPEYIRFLECYSNYLNRRDEGINVKEYIEAIERDLKRYDDGMNPYLQDILKWDVMRLHPNDLHLETYAWIA